jgi:hypothetical protein
MTFQEALEGIDGGGFVKLCRDLLLNFGPFHALIAELIDSGRLPDLSGTAAFGSEDAVADSHDAAGLKLLHSVSQVVQAFVVLLLALLGLLRMLFAVARRE